MAFPPWHETQVACMKEAESNVLAIDVESNNPSRGPLRVCAFVLLSYRNLFQYEVIDRIQFIVERRPDEYDEDGRLFWKEKAISIDHYFDHPTTVRLTPPEAARHIRAYLEHCWATVPRLAILIDEPQTDHALLYEFLKQHGLPPMCYDAKGSYKRNVHVTRDLMRGAFSMIDSRFINLEESDMYLYIHRYWQELVQHQQAMQKQQQAAAAYHMQLQNMAHGAHGAFAWQPTPTPPSPPAATIPAVLGLSTSLCSSPAVVALNESCIFRTQLGPEVKHVPIFDASQSLLVWAKMEDIKRLFHMQLVKIAMTNPSLLLLPKPGSNVTTHHSPYYYSPTPSSGASAPGFRLQQQQPYDVSSQH